MSRRVSRVDPGATVPESGQPLVSVVVPTHNRARLLARSIDSVLTQSWRNLELIVVDDASTDGTAAVLQSFADPRLRVIRRKESSSAAAARNAGILDARGEYVAFNDDDDVWLPEKLQKQVSALMAADVGVGLCLCARFLREPGREIQIGGDHLIREIDFSRGNGQGGPDYALIATPSWVARRAAFERTGLFDERLLTWEDWELALRFWLTGDVIVINEPLYIQDQLAGGNLFRLERAKAEALRIIEEKHGALWAGNRRVLARHQYVIGLARLLHEDRPAGRAELWRSVWLWPWSAKTWIALTMGLLSRPRAARLIERVRGWRAARSQGRGV